MLSSSLKMLRMEFFRYGTIFTDGEPTRAHADLHIEARAIITREMNRDKGTSKTLSESNFVRSMQDQTAHAWKRFLRGGYGKHRGRTAHYTEDLPSNAQVIALPFLPISDSGSSAIMGNLAAIGGLSLGTIGHSSRGESSACEVRSDKAADRALSGDISLRSKEIHR